MEKLRCPEKETCVTPPPSSHHVMEKLKVRVVDLEKYLTLAGKKALCPHHHIMETECWTLNIWIQCMTQCQGHSH